MNNRRFMIDTINDMLEQIDEMLPGPIPDALQEQLREDPDTLRIAETHIVAAMGGVQSVLFHLSAAADALGIPSIGDEDGDEWDLEDIDDDE